ncbi:MAG: aldehyde dehydrogenase [Rhodospirillaceae bacterium]|nr:aldehyde dehydrogenase [Rhodospirillaceae bacterium]|tara:strand:- start:30 stop:1427 length:1398 start_codon:yes stop_codon:yes gene_type:complete
MPQSDDVTAPWDGEHLGSVDLVDGTAVESALATAHDHYQNRSSWIPLAERIEILHRLAAMIQDRREELALLAASEGGKPLLDSLVEIDRGADGINCCIEAVRAEGGYVVPMGLNAGSQGRIAFTQKEPIGVVVAVSAFNHPFNLIIHQVAPAVAAGCPVIVKPADVTPLSCLKIVELFAEAGLPSEWCQVVMPENLDLATKLVTDERVGFFSFIGSARVGWMLRSLLSPGTRCALEHGGAAPVIVAADADFDDMMPLLAKGGFYHAGQVCVSVQRVFADNAIARDVADNLGTQAKAMKVGDPRLADTEVGPLIRHGEADRVETWVKEAVDAGAELVSGGNRLSESCYEPTVLYNPPAEAKVSQMEIFGPVVCIYPTETMEEGVKRANALPFAFQSSVFTTNIDTAMKAYRGLDASAVMVNEHTAFRVDWMPFAGLRQSGHGVGGIAHTVEDMQIDKMMVIRSKSL